MHLESLSFQLYSARREPSLDVQLAALAELGLRHVEPYGGLFAEPEPLVNALATHGLTAPSAHVGLDRLKADLKGVADTAARMGTQLLVIPALPPDERIASAAQWRERGATLEALSASVASAGMRLAWHNHDFEFARTAEGFRPLDLLLESAPSVLWEVDIGWLVRAGEPAARWLMRYAERVVAVHIKDVATEGACEDEDGWADVGYGTIDWLSLLPAIAATRAELFVLEHDNPSDFRRFVRRSRDTIDSWQEI